MLSQESCWIICLITTGKQHEKKRRIKRRMETFFGFKRRRDVVCYALSFQSKHIPFHVQIVLITDIWQEEKRGEKETGRKRRMKKKQRLHVPSCKVKPSTLADSFPIALSPPFHFLTHLSPSFSDCNKEKGQQKNKNKTGKNRRNVNSVLSSAL